MLLRITTIQRLRKDVRKSRYIFISMLITSLAIFGYSITCILDASWGFVAMFAALFILALRGTASSHAEWKDLRNHYYEIIKAQQYHVSRTR